MFAGSLLNNDDAALCDVGIHENDVVYLIEMKAGKIIFISGALLCTFVYFSSHCDYLMYVLCKTDKPSAVPDFPDKDIKHLMNVCYILQDKNIMKTVLQVSYLLLLTYFTSKDTRILNRRVRSVT